MTLKQQVFNTLESFTETRNNDITLMIKVWRRYYMSEVKDSNIRGAYVNLKSLYKIPTQDNIKRIRAEIQNIEHLFLPTSKEVAKKRLMLEKKWFQESFNKFNNI